MSVTLPSDLKICQFKEHATFSSKAPMPKYIIVAQMSPSYDNK